VGTHVATHVNSAGRALEPRLVRLAEREVAIQNEVSGSRIIQVCHNSREWGFEALAIGSDRQCGAALDG